MDDLVVVQIGDARKHLPGIASQAVVPQSMRSSCCCLSERCWVDVFNDYNVVVLFVVSFSGVSMGGLQANGCCMTFHVPIVMCLSELHLKRARCSVKHLSSNVSTGPNTLIRPVGGCG